MGNNQSKKNNKGRPAIEPTVEKLEIYRELAASGKTLVEISLISRISKPTLVKIFRKYGIRLKNGRGGVRANSGRKPIQKDSKTSKIIYASERPLPKRYSANDLQMLKWNIVHYATVKARDGTVYYPENEEDACQLPCVTFDSILMKGQRVTSTF